MRIETVLILVAVLALAAWVIRRHQVARADREAMYTYGHALEVLAEITHTNEGPDPRASEPLEEEAGEPAAATQADEPDSATQAEDPAGDRQESASEPPEDVAAVADTSQLPPPPDMSHLPPPPASVEPVADGHAPGDIDEPDEATEGTNEETEDELPAPVALHAHSGARSTVRRVILDDEGHEIAQEDPSVDESADADPSVPPPGLYRPHVELRPPPIRWATPKKRRDPGPAARRALGAVAALALVLAGASLLWALVDGGSDEETATPGDAPTTTDDPADEPDPAAPETEPTLPSPIPPQEVAGDTAAFSVDAPFELALAATAPCWVSLTDEAGNVLLEETLQDGEERTVEITQGASLRIGNAGALHVAADGALLEHGGGPGEAMTLTFG